MGSGRAGCGGSRKSGSEGGPEKPTNGNVGRALGSDPTSPINASMSVDAGYRPRSLDHVVELVILYIESDVCLLWQMNE